MLLYAGIGVIFAATGCYLAFFEPKWLSVNISDPLKHENAVKWTIASVIFIATGWLALCEFKDYSLNSWQLYFLAFLYFLAAIDAYSGIIPDRLLLASLAGWAYLFFTDFGMSESFLYAGIAAGSLMTIIRVGADWLVGKPGFGWGDIKLIALLGLFLGWDVFYALYAAVLLGGLFGGVGLLTGQLNKSSKLRFAPFIFLGVIAEFVFEASALILGY